MQAKKNDADKDDKQGAKPVPAREERSAVDSIPEIDFAKLDLSVEKVEERISPSETNVFDK
jgi:hypothetical protein